MAFLTVVKPGDIPVPESIHRAWVPFTDPLEGALPWMYLDVIGLVTTGRGNLIDPVGSALRLPWIRKDGHAAEVPEVQAAWTRIKSLQSMAKRGGVAFAPYTDIRLTPAAIDDLTNSKLHENWVACCKRFPWLRGAPADAQLGVMSMAWAMGAGFIFPKFETACAVGDWLRAEEECLMTKPPVPVKRNGINQGLFANAARVRREGRDPAALLWAP